MEDMMSLAQIFRADIPEKQSRESREDFEGRLRRLLTEGEIAHGYQLQNGRLLKRMHRAQIDRPTQGGEAFLTALMAALGNFEFAFGWARIDDGIYHLGANLEFMDDFDMVEVVW
ncbi:hypothetical protein KBB12_02655 [Candidatus Woesebacteria bacterium]|nr:hypothetical protein [Candidatus Woesebacteria bacterium]